MPLLELQGPAKGLPPVPASLPRRSDAAARKFGVLPMPKLEWNEEVARETAHLYERIKTVIPAVEWPVFAPYVKAINELKRQRNAVILAHKFQRSTCISFRQILVGHPNQTLFQHALCSSIFLDHFIRIGYKVHDPLRCPAVSNFSKARSYKSFVR